MKRGGASLKDSKGSCSKVQLALLGRENGASLKDSERRLLKFEKIERRRAHLEDSERFLLKLLFEYKSKGGPPRDDPVGIRIRLVSYIIEENKGPRIPKDVQFDVLIKFNRNGGGGSRILKNFCFGF